MTVVRLRSGSILLHSPCEPRTELISSLSQLGSIDHVVAPNWFHDLYLQRYRELFPRAQTWGPPFLKRQHPLLVDTVVNDDVPWFEEMPHVRLSGLLALQEFWFFHTSSKTLIVADALTNGVAPSNAPAPTKLGYRILGLDGGLKTFALLRWFPIGTRPSLRAAAEQVHAWKPERLIVGHGSPVTGDAAPAILKAIDWV
jgi:hypothetical protein